jgi:hypothetical protein
MTNKRELTPEERAMRSKLATITNLRRAGQPDYDGRVATAAATSASWQSWLDKAGGDPVKAQRLKTAALMEGRLKAKLKKQGRKGHR